MRTYPQDSAHSVARLVALAMLADGHLCSREFDALERAQTQLANGLERPELQALIQELCEDLMSSGHLSSMGGFQLDADTLTDLMAEIQDPELRLAVVRACALAIDADEHRADAETEVLRAAERCWGISRSLP